MKSDLTEYETIVHWDGSTMTRYYLDVAQYKDRRPLFGTRAIAFTHAQRLVTLSGARLVRWEPMSPGRSSDTAPAHRLDDEGECFACSQDGSLVVVGMKDRQLAIYPMDRDSPLPLFDLKGHEGSPRGVAFVTNRYVISGDSLGQIFLWTIPSEPKKEPTKIVPEDNPHKTEVVCVAGSGKSVYATADKDGMIRVGKVGQKEPLIVDRLDGEVIRAMSFPLKAEHLHVATEKQLLSVSLAKPQPLAELKLDEGDAERRGNGKEKK
jgi:WD40 repeat protein